MTKEEITLLSELDEICLDFGIAPREVKIFSEDEVFISDKDYL